MTDFILLFPSPQAQVVTLATEHDSHDRLSLPSSSFAGTPMAATRQVGKSIRPTGIVVVADAT
jgi:hypothetical protein